MAGDGENWGGVPQFPRTPIRISDMGRDGKNQGSNRIANERRGSVWVRLSTPIVSLSLFWVKEEWIFDDRNLEIPVRVILHEPDKHRKVADRLEKAGVDVREANQSHDASYVCHH